jgi:hypothetical protein
MAKTTFEEVLQEQRAAERNFEEAARSLVWAERNNLMVGHGLSDDDKEIRILSDHFKVGLDTSKEILTRPRQYNRTETKWWLISFVITWLLLTPVWVAGIGLLAKWGW